MWQHGRGLSFKEWEPNHDQQIKWIKFFSQKMSQFWFDCCWKSIRTFHACTIVSFRKKINVGCKWLHTIKYKANGSIQCYKARPIAKGYTKTYGFNYQETLILVAKINIAKVLLLLAANLVGFFNNKMWRMCSQIET